MLRYRFLDTKLVRFAHQHDRHGNLRNPADPGLTMLRPKADAAFKSVIVALPLFEKLAHCLQIVAREIAGKVPDNKRQSCEGEREASRSSAVTRATLAVQDQEEVLLQQALGHDQARHGGWKERPAATRDPKGNGCRVGFGIGSSASFHIPSRRRFGISQCRLRRWIQRG